MIISAYNILKNIDVASRVFMREVTPHSLFQCSVEALDDGGFNVRIARYPKTYGTSFSLRNFCIDCATNSLSLRLQVYGYSSFVFR